MCSVEEMKPLEKQYKSTEDALCREEHDLVSAGSYSIESTKADAENCLMSSDFVMNHFHFFDLCVILGWSLVM